MDAVRMRCWRGLFAALIVLLTARTLPAQPTKPPTAADVKALLTTFQAERDALVTKGIAQRFDPALLERADALAKKGAAMLTAGRFLQASEALRQARWQLPYQAPGTPAEHVARIVGSARLRHGGQIYAAQFSPDGRRLATASEDQTVKLWDVGNGYELLRYGGHADKVTALAFRPDGQAIASAGAEATIRLWDPNTGKDLRTLKVEGGEYVKAIAFSRDGKVLVAAYVGKPQKAGNGPAPLLVCFDVESGAAKRIDRDFRQQIASLAFTGDGALLAVASEDGMVRLWQYSAMIDKAKQPPYWLKQHEGGAIRAALFSPDGKTLACAGDNSVRLYNTPQPGATFKVGTPRLELRETPFTRSLAFSADGKCLFTGSFDGIIRSWDPESGEMLRALTGHSGAVHALTFNAASNQLASAAEDNTARLWDFDIVLTARDLAQLDAPVWSVVFSPDGERVVSAGGDKAVRVWDTTGGKAALTLQGLAAQPTAALYSPDGKIIASVGSDKLLRLWDAASGAPLRQGTGHTATVTALDFSSDGKRIVTGGADRRVIVWDADSLKQILTIDDNPSPVAAVAFRPDGKQIAVGSVDRTIALYDLARKLDYRWQAHGLSVNCLAYSPNSQLLASGGNDGLVKVWTIANSAPGVAAPVVVAGHSGPVSAVAFRRDNQHVASAGADRLVKLWKIEANSGKEIQTFRGHRDWVTSVAFNREGSMLVSGGVDRTIKVWEITSRAAPLLAEHTADVRALAVSPDGKQIATGSADNTIKIWDRATGALLASLTAHNGGVSALAYAPGGKLLVSSGNDHFIRLWDPAGFRELPRTAEQELVFRNMTRGSPYIAIAPDDKRLSVWFPVKQGTLTTVVECFEVPIGKRLYSFTESGHSVNSLSFCANGKLVATGSQTGSVRVWKLEDNRAEIMPGGDWNLFGTVGVADIALSPDGTTLVATSDKGEVKIADVAKRMVRKTFTAHPSRILGCQVSPDGKRCVTLGADNVLKCWDLADGKELRQWVLGPAPSAALEWNMTFAFTPDSRQLVTANMDTTLFVLDLP